MTNNRPVPFSTSELAAGLCWSPTEVVLVVWVYYDESGEYLDGKLVRMAIGGCVSTVEKWQRFDVAWRAILDAEGIPAFHMVDFEAWRPPFDFRLPDGQRDKERHNRILDAVIDAMAAHIEGFHGYFSSKITHAKAHQDAMEQCSVGAMHAAVRNIWPHYKQRLNLVFAKQKHYPMIGRRHWQSHYDLKDERIKAHIEADPKDTLPLQAADVFAYEILRRARMGRPVRYPYKKLNEVACTKYGARMTLQVGPFSPFYARERSRERSPGQP